MRLKFWGVRGSTPTPTARNARYGGNTTCLQVTLSDNTVLLFDSGTGAREFGEAWAGEAIRLFLSHFHWDHIQGLPFFAPMHSPDARIAIYATGAHGPIERVLAGQMTCPYFPLPWNALRSQKDCVEIDSAPIRLGPATVHPFAVHHPQGALGFRIEENGRSIVFAPDREHGDPKLDALLRHYSTNADLLILDSQYTPEEYERRRGWGHSTWLENTAVACDAGALSLALFHHDPNRDDDAVDAIVQQSRSRFEAVSAAREGAEIVL